MVKNKKRNIEQRGNKAVLIIKPSRKYKMTDDELQMHLHLIKTGHRQFKDKSKYSRKQKYAVNY